MREEVINLGAEFLLIALELKSFYDDIHSTISF